MDQFVLLLAYSYTRFINQQNAERSPSISEQFRRTSDRR